MTEVPYEPRGPQIPGYQLIERLGQGGMAEVWLAQRDGGSELVVIKRLLERHASSRTTQKRILREAQLGALLHHPNIARTVDAGVAEGELYIATGYLPGKDLETLSHCLARTQRLLPARIVARVMVDILSGLHAAHETRGPDGRPLGIVHRDLSPRNVQLSFDGRVAIIDFGLAHARVGGFHTEPGTVLGTYRYMSPEQAIGEPVDRRSDLFSLGTSMYELFTGQWLFDAGAKPDILKAIVEARLKAPSLVNPALPKALDPVILRAMAHHASDRYPTALAMKNALEEAVPKWCATPPSALVELLRDTFPHDAERAREHLLLAAHRGPRPEPRSLEVTREQPTSKPAAPRVRGLRVAEPTAVVRLRREEEKTEIVRKRPSGTAVVRVRVPARRPSGRRALPPGVDPDDQDELGEQYDLIRCLGRGGMGRIYLAQRRGAPDLSVLKIMHPDLVEQGGELQIQRFAREGSLLKRLHHPNIPALRALEVEGRSLPFMEMDHAAGVNLAELAQAQQTGSIPPQILIPLALQLLDALHHAHQLRSPEGERMGLVHRDISPTNLMVTFEGVAKLIDFGVAHRGDETLTSIERPLLGKVMYCSPEQALQQPLDQRSDLYSFGVSLFELLTGRPVVDPELDVTPARQCVVHEPIPDIREVNPAWPDAVQAVFARACAKSPHERFEHAAAFRGALDAATRRLPRAGREAIAAFVRRSAPAQFEDHTRLEEWAFAEDPAFEVSRSGSPSVLRRNAPYRTPMWQPILGGLAVLSLGIAIGVTLTRSTHNAVAFKEPELSHEGTEQAALTDSSPMDSESQQAGHQPLRGIGMRAPLTDSEPLGSESQQAGPHPLRRLGMRAPLTEGTTRVASRTKPEASSAPLEAPVAPDRRGATRGLEAHPRRSSEGTSRGRAQTGAETDGRSRPPRASQGRPTKPDAHTDRSTRRSPTQGSLTENPLRDPRTAGKSRAESASAAPEVGLCRRSVESQDRSHLFGELRRLAEQLPEGEGRGGYLQCLESLERSTVRYVGQWALECERCLRRWTRAATGSRGIR